MLAGDTVAYTGGSAAFDTKNVGNAKTVSATGLSLSGRDAGNYTVNSSATTVASIIPVPFTVQAEDASPPPSTSKPSFTASDDPVREASRAGSIILSIRDGGIHLPLGLK